MATVVAALMLGCFVLTIFGWCVRVALSLIACATGLAVLTGLWFLGESISPGAGSLAIAGLVAARIFA